MPQCRWDRGLSWFADTRRRDRSARGLALAQRPEPLFRHHREETGQEPLIGLLLVIAAALVLLRLGLSTYLFTSGIQFAGVGLLALAAGLLGFDVARRSLRRPGLPRFSGSALLAGYVWLGVAGLVWLLGPDRIGTFWYDAMLQHGLSWLRVLDDFGHAPTILPAISRIPLPFQRHFYGHLILLHISLVLRITGDLAEQPDARRWGGLLNEVSVLLFVTVTIAAARQAQATLRTSEQLSSSRRGRR